MTSILVVDDEPRIRDVVRRYLERDGYTVHMAADGQEALDCYRRDHPALVVLDLMLPGLDGWQVCREIRRESAVPIVMLTARADESDTLLGLDLGADDYVTKPFSPRELVARIRAVLRRSGASDAVATDREAAVVAGALVIDPARHESRWEDVPLVLTPTEFRLLATLAQARGRVLTRARLVDLAMGDAFDGYDRTVDAHVKNLRGKFREAGAPDVIETVRGIGYRFSPPPNDAPSDGAASDGAVPDGHASR